MMRLGFLLLLLSGCGGRRTQAARAALARQSAEALVAQARSRAVPLALRATFSISVQGPAFSGTTRGGLITHQPESLRLDVFTPLNTPLAYLASDGQAVHAWLQQERTFYRGEDAGAVLDELLGGLADVGDVIAVLTGTLPLKAAPVLDARYDATRDQLCVTLEGPQDVQVRAWLEPEGALLRELHILQPPQTVLMNASYDGYMRVEGEQLPRTVEITLPPLGWTVDLQVDTWSVLGQIPDVFRLSPPPGAVEKDLVQTLRELAEKQAIAPPD